jgi:uncharacterized protein (DUF1786 family)
MEKLSALFVDLDNERQVLLLVEIAHHLTIVAREAYLQGEVQDANKLMRANEFQHRLLRMISNKLTNERIHTDEEIVQRILVGFEEIGGLGALEQLCDRLKKYDELLSPRKN